MGDLLDRMFRSALSTGESFPGVPFVEIAGDSRVLIENHRGVICFSPKEIRVKVSYGCICVCGDKLEMARLAKEQLVILGRIEGISIFRGQGK